MIHYVTRAIENELLKNRQTGSYLLESTGWMAHKNGTFATIGNRMQHCGHYNYSRKDLEYTIICLHNNLSIAAVIEKYVSNLDTFNISRHPLYCERINKKNYVKANSNSRSS